MINEKMLEYLMLDKVLFTPNGEYSDRSDELLDEDSNTFDVMLSRLIELEDEFVNEFKTTPTSITNPLSDIN